MIKRERVRINETVIRECVAKKGTNLARLSVDIGHGHSFLNQCFSDGLMYDNVVRNLADKLEVPADILIINEPKKETEVAPVQTEMVMTDDIGAKLDRLLESQRYIEQVLTAIYEVLK